MRKVIDRSEFLEYLTLKIPEFVRHDFTYWWEDAQFRKSLQVFPVGTILSIIDYAENYMMSPQDAIQSDHWTNTIMTILVHIVYFHGMDSTFAAR